MHRIAVDNIADGYSETYCGLRGSLFNDDFQDHCNNDDITCPDCREEVLKDRLFSRGPRKDDPQWLKDLFVE